MTDFETRRADWLSVDDAVRRVVSAATGSGVETLLLPEALGRALATPIQARATLPPWDNSAMDGYALRASDVRGAAADRPVRLPVSGIARAGEQAPQALLPGAAVRIMTGAPVPAGADSVIRVEDTDRESGPPGMVEVRSDRDAGRNVRPAGQDMRAGDVVLHRGATLGPGQLAVAAAAGHARVEVFKPARVAVVSNGDELRTLDDWDDVLHGTAIPETNGLMLVAAASAAGALAERPRLARDSAASILEQVTASLDADVLITSGGASMGEADLFKRVLDELGLELVLWRVTLRPGSPFSFGFLPRPAGPPVAVFGLPGNPTSAFVTFELFVRPFLLRFAGHTRVHRAVLRVVAGEPLTAAGRLTHFHRVVLRDTADGPTAFLTGPQGSGLVHGLARADALAVVPLGVERIEPGDPVEVLLVGDAHAALEAPGYRSAAP